MGAADGDAAGGADVGAEPIEEDDLAVEQHDRDLRPVLGVRRPASAPFGTLSVCAVRFYGDALEMGGLSATTGVEEGAVQAIAAGLLLTLLSALLLLKTSNVGLAMLALGGFSAGGGFAAAAALIGLQSMVIAEQRFAANTIFLSTVTMTGYGLGPWLTGVVSDNLGDHDLRLALALITLGAATVAGLGALAGRFVKLALAR